jgi:5-deoxy-glucuronate isomerase
VTAIGPAISEAGCVIRATHAGHGRYPALAPGLAAVEHLRYGRIRLNSGDAPVAFGTEEFETGLICLRGRAEVRVRQQAFRMTPFDALYIPRDEAVIVACQGENCDLAEVSSDVENRYPLQFVSYEEVRRDSGLHFEAGTHSCRRDLNILIGKNVQAGRIVAGVTFSDPGNWTSWPPHEHAEMLEEAYLYIEMPPPAWGIQLVYTNPEQPELITAVREGDCVVMPKGYHPNVAAPGGSIGFLWMMAAHREVTDRQFGVVNVQPEYASGGSGLETGRAAE